jgi:hypothetical protein
MGMKDQICSGCGKRFVRKAASWNMLIKLWADFDGDIDYADKSDKEIDATLDRLLERISYLDAKTLEDEIYQEIRFRLCKDCRDRFVANPLNLPIMQPPPSSRN